jgi:hypothetical protein
MAIRSHGWRRCAEVRARCSVKNGNPVTMEPPFERLLARLADANVRFVLVGGLAVALNGYVRLTEDVDILIEPSEPNVRRLLECLADFGEGFARELSVGDFSDEEGAIRIVEEAEHCQLDIFTRMTGLHYADIASDAVRTGIGGREIRHASKAALIRLKSASVREKDRLDVAALQRLEQDPRAFD